MPLYEAQCKHCSSYLSYFATVENRSETPFCCGRQAAKVILTAPGLGLDIAPWDAYESPASGKIITSKAERRKDFEATGCRPWEGREQEEKEAQRHRRYQEEVEDRELTKTVEQSFRELPEPLKALTTD